MKHRKMIFALLFIIGVLTTTAYEAKAQFVITEVIKLTVTKSIKAIDLKVQRMQNKTIWLQNAQKVIENQLSKLKLTEISGWTDQQKKLYSDYYTELWKIKSTISYYQRIKDVTVKQASLVEQYRRAWSLFKQDKHFKPEELSYMENVYGGILKASMQNLDQIMLVINGFKTQMTDEQRLELIEHASDQLDENYNDLKQFNNQNISVSLQRSRDLAETKTIRSYYGIK